MKSNGVKNVIALRKKVKYEIIRRYILLFNSVFGNMDKSVGMNERLKTSRAQTIVRLYRRNVGYSLNTQDIDILYQAWHNYQEFNSGLTNHQRRNQ